MDFKERVKFIRKKLNISQEKLARELRVSFATVNRWETGKSKPSYDNILDFEKFCNNNKIKEEKNNEI